jgi:hypothetical protein
MNSIMQDPAFAMFVTAAGLQDELALADAARRRHAINQALGIETEQIGEQGEKQRRGIAGQHEASGTFKSGQNLQEQAESERSQARAQSLAQLNAANQLGDIESGLLTGQANRQFDIATKALGSAEGLALEQGDSDIDARLKALEGAGTSPLTGIGGVGPLGPEGPGPALPVAGVGISRKEAFNPTGKYKRAF